MKQFFYALLMMPALAMSMQSSQRAPGRFTPTMRPALAAAAPFVTARLQDIASSQEFFREISSNENLVSLSAAASSLLSLMESYDNEISQQQRTPVLNLLDAANSIDNDPSRPLNDRGIFQGLGFAEVYAQGNERRVLKHILEEKRLRNVKRQALPRTILQLMGKLLVEGKISWSDDVCMHYVHSALNESPALPRHPFILDVMASFLPCTLSAEFPLTQEEASIHQTAIPLMLKPPKKIINQLEDSVWAANLKDFIFSKKIGSSSDAILFDEYELRESLIRKEKNLPRISWDTKTNKFYLSLAKVLQRLIDEMKCLERLYELREQTSEVKTAIDSIEKRIHEYRVCSFNREWHETVWPYYDEIRKVISEHSVALLRQNELASPSLVECNEHACKLMEIHETLLIVHDLLNGVEDQQQVQQLQVEIAKWMGYITEDLSSFANKGWTVLAIKSSRAQSEPDQIFFTSSIHGLSLLRMHNFKDYLEREDNEIDRMAELFTLRRSLSNVCDLKQLPNLEALFTRRLERRSFLHDIFIKDLTLLNNEYCNQLLELHEKCVCTTTNINGWVEVVHTDKCSFDRSVIALPDFVDYQGMILELALLRAQELNTNDVGARENRLKKHQRDMKAMKSRLSAAASLDMEPPRIIPLAEKPAEEKSVNNDVARLMKDINSMLAGKSEKSKMASTIVELIRILKKPTGISTDTVRKLSGLVRALNAKKIEASLLGELAVVVDQL